MHKPNDKNFIEVFADDFVVHCSGEMTIQELEQQLQKYDLESQLSAPSDYKIKQILLENYGYKTGESCLGLVLKHHSGELTKTGGQVIKNVSGYDLSKIYIGSNGEFADIQSAYLKLHKLAKHQLIIEYEFNNIEELQDLVINSLIEKQNNIVKDWDHTTITAIACPKGNTTLRYCLFGEEELLELRKRKIQSALGTPKFIEEKSYPEKKYSEGRIKIEINSIYPDLFEIALLFQKELSQKEIIINLQAKSIEIYFSNSEELNSHKEIFKSILIKHKNTLLEKDFFIQIYPQNQAHKELQNKLNLHGNDFENKIINKLEEVFN